MQARGTSASEAYQQDVIAWQVSVLQVSMLQVNLLQVNLLQVNMLLQARRAFRAHRIAFERIIHSRRPSRRSRMTQ